MVDLSFESRTLRALCENEATALSQLGETLAAELRDRLADIRAAQSPLDLQQLGLGRPIGPDKTGIELFIIDLDNNARIVFCANHTLNPKDNQGHVDWAKVSRVKVLEIGNPHAPH